MTKVTVPLAVVFLILASACRAGEDSVSDLPLPPVHEDGNVVPLDKPKELPAQDVDKSEQAPDASASATTPQDDAPQTASPAADDAGEAPCPGKAGHVQRLWQWLTYQPLERPGLCGCCHHCVPYCHAPLYAFFPCYGGGCAAPACASCTQGVPAAPRHRLGLHLRARLHRTQAEPAVAEPVPAPPPADPVRHAE